MHNSYLISSSNELQPPLVLPRRITHPNLPKGKEQVTSANELQPPLVLPRRGEAGYSVSDKPLIIKQSSVSVPPLRGRLGGG